MKWLLAVLVICILSGCSNRNVPPLDNIQLTCRLRPVRILNNGESPWVPEKLNAQLAQLDRVYGPAGMCFNILAIEDIEDANLFDVAENFAAICRLSKEFSDRRGELAVFYVNSVTGVGGQNYGGLANYPSNLMFTIYQHGIVISKSSYDHATVHEVGHAFNLPHSWEHMFGVTDTVGTSPSDCGSFEKSCNVMSYCSDVALGSFCDGFLLTPNQKTVVTTWTRVYPRNQVVVAEDKNNSIKSSRLIFEYTANTQPAH